MVKDILSQSEIDSIINAIGSGDLPSKAQQEEASPKSAVLYDFRRPNKFSKDQMRTLKIIHENFARMLTNFFTAYLRVPVTVNLESTSQVTYDEFIYSLPLPTVVTVFRFSQRNGSALIETDPFFTSPIIDILFGGTGKVAKPSRELTEIEISVLTRVNEKILSHLHYAWEDIAEINPEIETVDTNPQFSQLLASNEAVALLNFSTDINGSGGFLNFCLPYITLEPILPRLSAQNWYARQSKGSSWDLRAAQRDLEKRLKRSEVELTAVLGGATISVADFLNFEEGDIIILDSQLDKPIDLYLEGQPKFKIELGISGAKMAGVIAEIILEKEQDNE